MSSLNRLVGVADLVFAWLGHSRSRTLLGILGVAIAVLAVTLLISIGHGVLTTGEELFQSTDRDLWATGGPVRLAPGTVGGIQNGLTDAHHVARDLRSHEDVRQATPILFQMVYAGTNSSNLRAFIGVGVPNDGKPVDLQSGDGFTTGEKHRAGGDYTGPMTYEVIIDPRTASTLDVEVGDEIHVGGTIASARRNKFTVVGVSPTFSKFLGTPTITMHLDELQEITGKTGTDEATYIALALHDGANPERVQEDLQETHPDLQIRTNREQLQSMLRDQAIIIGGAGVLILAGVLGGAALTINLLALVVYHQRYELAALKSIGVSSRTLASVVAGQALLFGVLGGGLGLLITPAAATALNYVAAHLVGFEGLVRTPTSAYTWGGVTAVLVGTISAYIAGRRITRLPPLRELDS